VLLLVIVEQTQCVWSYSIVRRNGLHTR